MEPAAQAVLSESNLLLASLATLQKPSVAALQQGEGAMPQLASLVVQSEAVLVESFTIPVGHVYEADPHLALVTQQSVGALAAVVAVPIQESITVCETPFPSLVMYLVA